MQIGVVARCGIGAESESKLLSGRPSLDTVLRLG
jgi:hypothetical protein